MRLAQGGAGQASHVILSPLEDDHQCVRRRVIREPAKGLDSGVISRSLGEQIGQGRNSARVIDLGQRCRGLPERTVGFNHVSPVCDESL